MIKVENLTKIYQAKNNMQVKALDNLSFVLPDNGLVFVIGKSGSGKSTLLNMLGGLDGMTSGDIVADGNRFSQFKQKDYDKYRNTRIGFVFQDFHLIDGLNVYDNVSLSLDLQNKPDKQAVLDAIEKVGLAGVEKRFPQELSGGQKQRIAIARALVKKPNIILADEPTGNLDSKTSKQILDLLKEVSDECLVVTVSHNLPDAYKYADRIIELEDGKIKKDVQKTADFCDEVVITDKTIKIPQREILPKEKTAINTALKKGGITRFEQAGTEYKPTEQPEYVDKKVELRSSKITFKKGLGLITKMSRKSLLFSVFYSIMTACVIIILATSQILVAFDTNKIVQREASSAGNSAVVMRRNWSEGNEQHSMNLSITAPVTAEDEHFFVSGGADNFDRLVNYSFAITGYGATSTVAGGKMAQTSLAKNIYVNELAGTLVTDEEFLLQTFGKNGVLPLHCGDIEDKPYGVVVTDYFVDSLLFNAYGDKHEFSYQDMLGEIKPKFQVGGSNYLILQRVGYINAIIDTDYETKYKDLLAQYENKENLNSKEIARTEMFTRAADEICQYLAVGYSTNPNFVQALQGSEAQQGAYMGYSTAKNPDDITTLSTVSTGFYLYKGSENEKIGALTGNEMVMLYTVYNSLFKTDYSSKIGEGTPLKDFVPHDVVFTVYDRMDATLSKPLRTYTFTIKKLTQYPTGSPYCAYVSDEYYSQVKANMYYTSALYFANDNNADLVYDLANERGFLTDSIIVSSVQTMAKAVSVFSDLFKLISFVLYVAAIFLVIYFGLKTVNKRMYEIGILRGLGSKNRSIAWMFAFQIVVTGIVTCIMSYFGLYVFVNIADEVLVRALMASSQGYSMLNIELISFNVPIIIADCGGVMLLSLLSTLIPLFALRRVKPINIIKAKEL